MVLIVSSTKGNNLKLANSLAEVCSELQMESEVINLEDYGLPLYTPEQESAHGVPQVAHELGELFKKSSALIFCAPEYNGTTPPILNNAIAWLSRTDEGDWRSSFNGKFSIVATHSGGGGAKVLNALRSMLEHLGSVVLPRTILTTYSIPLKKDSAHAILEQLKSFIS